MMKPKKTWIVLADAQTVRIAVNDGPGKGLYAIGTKEMAAKDIVQLSDAPGMTKSPAGPNRGGITEPDLKRLSQEDFAKTILDFLDEAYQSGAFHQFVLVASPNMLGVMRRKISATLQNVLRADIPKDLNHLPIDALASHLDDVLVV